MSEIKPVAMVAEVHLSRYTIEWINGNIQPEGTLLFVSPQQPAQEPVRTQFLDRSKEKVIGLMWQGKCDGTVEAFDVNGMMTIPSPEGVTYVRREDAISFFGLVEPVKQESWISVEERLPDGDRFVDVFVKSRSNLAYGTRFTEFRFINGQFDVSSLPSACYVSHWMPLPLPPEGDKP